MNSNAITVKEDNSLETILRDVETMQRMCQSLLKTKHYQNLGEAGVFAIVQKAKSLNINALEALNGGLYYLQGKVGMSSEMMASLIRQKGHSIVKDQKSDNSVCILHGKRVDNADTWTVSFSMEDARRAGLAKNMYDKYPSIMLYNRAMSMLARQLFPDVIKGAGYTLDELIEIKSSPSNQISDSVSTIESIRNIICEEQASEIISILSECSTEYQSQVMKFIQRAPINAESINDLPVEFYERVLTSALRKREEYQCKLKSKESLEEVAS
jgi:hypothetical protein